MFAALVLLALAVPAAAQDPSLIGLPVTAVHIEIEGRRESAPDLRDLIETSVGSPLDARQARESIAHLFAVGRFDDVRVEAVRENAGVAVIYKLMPRHPVRRITVSGDTGISEAALRDALETRFEGLAAAPAEADATAAVLVILRDEGFLSARATMRAGVSHAPHETTLSFDVEAGQPAPIGAVQVEGDWPGGREALLAALNARPGQPYRRSAVRDALDRLVAEMRATGRYAASASHVARPAASGGVMDLVIDADAGPIVTVQFEGDAIARDRLDALVPIERERAVDIDLLEDATIRIVNDLRREGYWRANAIYRTAETDGRMTVTFTITRGPRFRLGELAITGNRAVSSEALASFVDLAVGDIFVEQTLARGALAIREYYRRAGFASADVKLDVAEMPGDGSFESRMRATMTVTEGPQSFVRAVTFTGVTAVGEADLRRRMQSRAGDPYYPAHLAADRDAIQRAYLDRGYQQAAIAIEPAFDGSNTGVSLTVAVNEGPQTVVDRVIVVGNNRTDLQTILDELTLTAGSPLGLSDIVESQRRLSALGLFRGVRITQGSRQPGATAVDLIVTIEEAPATTIGYGGGLEMVESPRAVTADTTEDRTEFVPRAFFEITRRNIAGGNRSVSLFTRLSMGPNDVPGDPERDGKGFGVREYRVVGSYREPRAFRFDADVIVSASFERANRTSFSFDRQSLSADLLKRFTAAVRAGARYSLEYTSLVDQGISEEERLPIDRLFPKARLSIVSGSIVRDTRSDPVDPDAGALMTWDLDLAPRAIGSEVGFVKSFGQLLYFRRLTAGPRIIVAGGARVGLARGFARIVDNSVPLVTLDQIEVREIPASQRFFAGGSTTVRGFQLDRLGVPAILNSHGLSNGGNAMVVLNGELRFPLYKDVGAVAFVDAGQVFARVSDFDITAIRPTAGVGLRYRSPIGPLRLDVGFKLNRQTFPNRREHGAEWHFSLGQAF